MISELPLLIIRKVIYDYNLSLRVIYNLSLINKFFYNLLFNEKELYYKLISLNPAFADITLPEALYGLKDINSAQQLLYLLNKNENIITLNKEMGYEYEDHLKLFFAKVKENFLSEYIQKKESANIVIINQLIFHFPWFIRGSDFKFDSEKEYCLKMLADNKAYFNLSIGIKLYKDTFKYSDALIKTGVSTKIFDLMKKWLIGFTNHDNEISEVLDWFVDCNTLRLSKIDARISNLTTLFNTVGFAVFIKNKDNLITNDNNIEKIIESLKLYNSLKLDHMLLNYSPKKPLKKDIKLSDIMYYLLVRASIEDQKEIAELDFEFFKKKFQEIISKIEVIFDKVFLYNIMQANEEMSILTWGKSLINSLTQSLENFPRVLINHTPEEVKNILKHVPKEKYKDDTLTPYFSKFKENCHYELILKIFSTKDALLLLNQPISVTNNISCFDLLMNNRHIAEVLLDSVNSIDGLKKSYEDKKKLIDLLHKAISICKGTGRSLIALTEEAFDILFKHFKLLDIQLLADTPVNYKDELISYNQCAHLSSKKDPAIYRLTVAIDILILLLSDSSLRKKSFFYLAEFEKNFAFFHWLSYLNTSSIRTLTLLNWSLLKILYQTTYKDSNNTIHASLLAYLYQKIDSIDLLVEMLQYYNEEPWFPSLADIKEGKQIAYPGGSFNIYNLCSDITKNFFVIFEQIFAFATNQYNSEEKLNKCKMILAQYLGFELLHTACKNNKDLVDLEKIQQAKELFEKLRRFKNIVFLTQFILEMQHKSPKKENFVSDSLALLNEDYMNSTLASEYSMVLFEIFKSNLFEPNIASQLSGTSIEKNLLGQLQIFENKHPRKNIFFKELIYSITDIDKPTSDKIEFKINNIKLNQLTASKVLIHLANLNDFNIADPNSSKDSAISKEPYGYFTFKVANIVELAEIKNNQNQSMLEMLILYTGNIATEIPFLINQAMFFIKNNKDSIFEKLSQKQPLTNVRNSNSFWKKRNFSDFNDNNNNNPIEADQQHSQKKIKPNETNPRLTTFFEDISSLAKNGLVAQSNEQQINYVHQLLDFIKEKCSQKYNDPF